MRIGVDYRLANRHLGGMAVYLRSLVGTLKEIDKQNDYVLFDDNPTGSPGFKKHAWTVIWEHIWLHLCLPYLFVKEKIKIAYFPNPPVSFFITIPTILTIADVSFLHDASMPRWTKWYLWIMYFLSAHKARVITTLSKNSKQDIAKFFNVNLDKIYVTPLAAPDTIRRYKTKVKGLPKYVLTVPGTFIRRKNVEETVLAFSNLSVKTMKDYQLLIVGHTQGKDFEKLKLFMAEKDMSDKVIFTGRVNDLELSRLYSQAKLFVCSSLYEGFGLPILEAMRCGTPVISYNNSSLPEVVGNAGILVNNVEELEKAMIDVLRNTKLQARLRSLGLKRASLFSWRKTAACFLTVLKENVL